MSQPDPNEDTLGGVPVPEAPLPVLREFSVAIGRTLSKRQMAALDELPAEALEALQAKVAAAIANRTPRPTAPRPPAEVRGKRMAAWTGSKRAAVFVLDTTGAEGPAEDDNELLRRVAEADVKVEGLATFEVEHEGHVYLFENCYLGENAPRALEWAAEQIESWDDPSEFCICDPCLDRRQAEHRAEFGDGWLAEVRATRERDGEAVSWDDDELRAEVRVGMTRKRLPRPTQEVSGGI